MRFEAKSSSKLVYTEEREVSYSSHPSKIKAKITVKKAKRLIKIRKCVLIHTAARKCKADVELYY